jgi:hypothetical protein
MRSGLTSNDTITGTVLGTKTAAVGVAVTPPVTATSGLSPNNLYNVPIPSSKIATELTAKIAKNERSFIRRFEN